MKIVKKFHVAVTGHTTPTEDALLPPEAGKAVEEEKAITPEKLAVIQDIADKNGVLLPTEWNKQIPREYADDNDTPEGEAV